jgi:hypothetical protein
VIRLRPKWPDEELAKIYARPHDHRRWRDHHLRIGVTTAVATWMADAGLGSAADLSCGNGAVLNAVKSTTKFYGDYAPGYTYTGPIEETIDQIPHVDLFICCETLEHLDDPGAALVKIREKASMILLSTPVDNWGDPNPEHSWRRPGSGTGCTPRSTRAPTRDPTSTESGVGDEGTGDRFGRFRGPSHGGGAAPPGP